MFIKIIQPIVYFHLTFVLVNSLLANVLCSIDPTLNITLLACLLACLLAYLLPCLLACLLACLLSIVIAIKVHIRLSLSLARRHLFAHPNSKGKFCFLTTIRHFSVYLFWKHLFLMMSWRPCVDCVGWVSTSCVRMLHSLSYVTHFCDNSVYYSHKCIASIIQWSLSFTRHIKKWIAQSWRKTVSIILLKREQHVLTCVVAITRDDIQSSVTLMRL